MLLENLLSPVELRGYHRRGNEGFAENGSYSVPCAAGKVIMTIGLLKTLNQALHLPKHIILQERTILRERTMSHNLTPFALLWLPWLWRTLLFDLLSILLSANSQGIFNFSRD